MKKLVDYIIQEQNKFYNKMIYKLKHFIFLIMVCMTYFSCENSKKDADKYLPGIYFYKIPSGELQILEINQDFTFQQIVYSKDEKNVLYKNKGKLYVNDKDIKLEHWLECYEDSDQKFLLKPYITNSSSGAIYWKKPKRNEDVLIIIFDQNNYIFRKKSPAPQSF
ncbi:hypothetical protein ACFSX9_00380 [Flavobacterium ardleyense]|uniref:Lipoprotein n=1 Tax=Flavobacterium ardleyense TaxID=2038737 RepID=A0ABW5Z347_9FLAO